MTISYIGCATDSQTRYKATSGGVGSAILKYLFDNKIIQTSITFDYNHNELQYIPRLIYKYEDYNITGSIYHEIKLIQFIKQHIHEIRGSFACFVLPCQARAIRSMLEKADIPNLLIGLTCSSQQSIEATYYLLKRMKINQEDVYKIQYRGNGWPSGIQITLNNHTNKFIPNNNSIWTEIFHSKLFIQKRCFSCNNTLNEYSDIALADPWLKEYIQKEKEGKSIILCHSKKGAEIVHKTSDCQYIKFENIEYQKVLQSQIFTITRKKQYRYNQRIINIIYHIYNNKIYRQSVLKHEKLLRLHNKLKNIFENLILR